jgi:hypothetical protein
MRRNPQDIGVLYLDHGTLRSRWTILENCGRTRHQGRDIEKQFKRLHFDDLRLRLICITSTLSGKNSM